MCHNKKIQGKKQHCVRGSSARDSDGRLQKKQMGFSLIELIATMTITAVVCVLASVFMRYPIIAYADVALIGELVDSGESALYRMSADLREALPNSVRVKTSGSITAIEFMNVVESQYYRAGTPTPYLKFSNAVSQFDTLGLFVDSLSNTTCIAGNCRVVVDNTGTYGANTDTPIAGLNVYNSSAAPGPSPAAGSYVMTPSNVTVTLSNAGNSGTEGQISLSSAVLFAQASANQLVYIVDTPISYICDTSTGLLTRYWGYTVSATQPTTPGGSSAPMAQNISACSVNYTPSTATQNGVVSMSLTFSKSGNTVRIMGQTAVRNAL